MIDVGLDVTCDLDYALGLKPRPDFKNSPRRADLIHWVICGAESGHGARPMEEDWASFALAQCREAGVPFFMKQLCDARGRKIPFAQWPKDLKVREWPKAVTDVAAW
jgi:protein gp37